MSTIQQFDYEVDLLQAILWQYNDATNLQSLITQKQFWYQLYQTDFWINWFSDVFNLQTAQEFGLYVWSIILNFPILLAAGDVDNDRPIFGFNTNFGSLINDNSNFFFGNFATGNQQPFTLTVPQQRLILKLRYFQLATRGDVLDINAFLKFAFSDPELGYTGQVYVIDNYNMSITYVFTDTVPTPLPLFFETYDILPRPAGVKINFIISAGPIFGFSDNTGSNGNRNFMNGTFIQEG